MTPPLILIVDDDTELASMLVVLLREQGWQAQTAATGQAGEQLLQSLRPAAVLLDVMLPDASGLDLCRQWRQLDPEVGLLMLTARGDALDRVLGLELGADDYLPKPFEPRELAARLQTILRRARPAPVAAAPASPAGSVLSFDGLQIDTARREVLRLGQAVPLTGTEYELLLVLAREPQRVFHRDEILNRLRGRDADLATRAVDILVSRLRRKLEPLPAVKTLRNAGYALALAPLAGVAPGPGSMAAG